MEDDSTRPAFVVDGELDPSSGEPADGFTYLKTVRWESNRLADYHVSSINPRQFDNKQTRLVEPSKDLASTTPADRIPPEHWQQSLLATVLELRTSYFEQRREFEDGPEETLTDCTYPQMKDEQGWIRFCFGEESVQKSEDPLLSHLIMFDEVAILRMLKYHIKWSKSSSWTPKRLQWMFALLVCLDLPIEADMQAELWQLRSNCVKARAESSLNEEEVIAGLNVLITILERVFGQREC